MHFFIKLQWINYCFLDGYSYEKSAIEEWLQSGKETSPMTNETLAHKLLIPNLILLQLIQKYKT